MKTVKTDIVLCNFKGEPLQDGGKDLTIGSTISFVLAGRVSNPTFGWQFGKKFATEDSVDLKAEDIVEIKKELNANAAAGGLSALIVGQIIEILDGTEETKKTRDKAE